MNDLHRIEIINPILKRVVVPSGWIYIYDEKQMVFVPDLTYIESILRKVKDGNL